MKPFAVAIVSYNTCERLRACLATVVAEAPSEIVVVDNASSDDSAAMVRNEYLNVVLQVNGTNVGYGAAANQAIARCRAEYVLLLNPDTLLRPGTLRALNRYLDQNPRAAIVGPRLLEADGKIQASCYPFPTPFDTLLENSAIAVFLGRRIRRYVPVLRNLYLRTWAHDRPRIVPWIKGAVLAIRRTAFDAVGGFDESYFMYFEDADLCYRLNAAGWQIHFTPEATVVHIGGVSTRQCRAEMSTRLLESTLLFYRKHASRLQCAAATFIIKALGLSKWLTGSVRLYLTRDPAKRSEIAAETAAWRNVLFSPMGDTPLARQCPAPDNPLIHR
jgi:N-acetylglucosaminyl-diphospho-decaprenol L-rhamnosyltransferase